MNPYVDKVIWPSSYCICNQYVLEIKYQYEEYHQLLSEEQNISWDNSLYGKYQNNGKYTNTTMKKHNNTLIVHWTTSKN